MGLIATAKLDIEDLLLSEMKIFLRVLDEDGSTDYTVKDLIAAAIDRIEDRCRRSIRLTTWELTLSSFNSNIDDQYRLDFTSPRGSRKNVIVLPKPPLVSVSSIVYLDEGGNPITLASDQWEFDNTVTPGVVRPAFNTFWPICRSHPKAVKITYTAGYATASAMPAGIRQLVRLIVGHWYENREATITGTIITEIPEGVKHLMAQYQIPRVW